MTPHIRREPDRIYPVNCLLMNPLLKSQIKDVILQEDVYSPHLSLQETASSFKSKSLIIKRVHVCVPNSTKSLSSEKPQVQGWFDFSCQHLGCSNSTAGKVKNTHWSQWWPWPVKRATWIARNQGPQPRKLQVIRYWFNIKILSVLLKSKWNIFMYFEPY